MGFIDGTSMCPSSTLNWDGQVVPNLAYTSWICQRSIVASCNLHFSLSLCMAVMSLVASTWASYDASQKLTRLYNLQITNHAFEEQVILSQHGTKSISEYLQAIKCTPNELALINSLILLMTSLSMPLKGLGLTTRRSWLLFKHMKIWSNLRSFTENSLSMKCSWSVHICRV